MSRHVRRQVVEQIEVDKIVVWQQDDGLWRWRWFPASGEGEPLLSNEGYESPGEAEESARSAYPQTTRVAIEKPDHSLMTESGHAAGKGCGAVLAGMAVAVLVLLRRRKLERQGELG